MSVAKSFRYTSEVPFSSVFIVFNYSRMCSAEPTRLEVFAVKVWLALFIYGFFLFPLIAILLLFTSFRMIMLLYFLWMIIDRNTCEKGGRTIEFSRNFFLWKYFANYFPVNAILSTPLNLDPKKNYIFVAFPHGIISVGPTIDFRSNYGKFRQFFPNHTPYSITLPLNFHVPFYRELVLAVGSCSSSKKSIEYLLSDPKGGNAIGLMAGGAAEVQYSQPGGIYKLVLRNRKGFIKLALKHGTPIVPLFSFGEIDLFDHVLPAEGSILSKFLIFVKKFTRIQLIVPKKGFAGFIPERRPLNVVCKYRNLHFSLNYNHFVFLIDGSVIDTPKTEYPTDEEVNELQQKLIAQLEGLFEKYKYSFLDDPNNAKLVIL